jgi:hypothetical protein
MFRLIRKFFWLVLGFALGASSSVAITRRVRNVSRRYVPAEVRDRWGTNVRAALDEGKTAMRAREAELKGRRGA